MELEKDETLQTRMTRIVLLGASNLSFAFAHVVAAARAALPDRSLAVLVAAGFGRSYGVSSRVLVRGISGIISCGLWSRLSEGSPAPTHALLTDIGNDLGYGYAPSQIVSWVQTCLDRLDGAMVTMTLLPLASLERLGPVRFRIARAILFPRSTRTREELLGAAAELNERLRTVAGEYGATLIDPETDWYGPDRIHLRPACWSALAQAVVESWSPERGVPVSVPWREMLRSWLLVPEQQRICGLPAGRRQPSTTSHNLTVSLF